MHSMMIVRANEGSERDLLSDGAEFAELLQFHDSMVRAGVVLSVEALQLGERCVCGIRIQ
jgi:hypothetical protein